MKRQAIVPDELAAYYDDWKMAPGHLSNNLLFLTGFTGVDKDGHLSPDPETQIRVAFKKIGYVLQKADLGFEALVEMTSYHVDLKEHFEKFNSVRAEFVKEPYPAWTAVEVAGFIAEGAIVEIRAIAQVN